ncbi:SDR family oxidoreductase [Neorhizobium sp. AL 9.2.2]|uniref:SDR family oxidoreductase n=1 Tax=Neorhizobium sp. AL 9.2.2 TaxID=2712894 RepID=UPI001573F595|nr:SDR family NAD(P)-dependent oxidoreductase [Neorhizobium sp. AL 9.2.2]NSY18757.1 SDR family NAD(P)-dependent oxidoreductase [Neorhizobium sp. AL 9.2.2]
MDFTKATILITGGNSGIGRGLAIALSERGAKVIVTGRNEASLNETLKDNPALSGYQLDVTDKDGLNEFAASVVMDHPDLTVVIHNAGIMERENVLADVYDVDVAERTITTNLLAPIWLTSALLPHLRQKPEAAIVTVSSGLAFVPRTDSMTYSATKAAIHSWTMSLRHELRSTKIAVVELAPPQVATELTPGQSKFATAMPLADFVSESVGLLCADPTPSEVMVQRVMRQRTAEATGNFDQVFAMINPS